MTHETTSATTTTTATLAAYSSDLRAMSARFAGTCAHCGAAILSGAPIQWSRERGAFHHACVARQSAEESAAATAAKAARAAAEAERMAAWEADRKEAAKARRITRAAEKVGEDAALMAAPVERYHKAYDNRNSEVCDRCGGTGRMPFAAYQGVCLKCIGEGRVYRAQVTQPRGATVELGEAVVGSIVSDTGGTKYRVTSITWRIARVVVGAPSYNQRVHLVRLIDGDTRLSLLRDVFQTAVDGQRYSYIEVSAAMAKQEAERDERGMWRVY